MKKLSAVLVGTIIGLSTASLASCDTTAKQIKIGILQIVTHTALNADEKGFVEELASEGFVDGDKIKITYDIAEGDSSTETSMAVNLATNCDMVFGISTSSSLALKNAVADLDKTTPVLFSAVTDPASSGLVASFADHGNVIGTSDGGPTDKNIELFTDFTSLNIKKIGIMYNSAESNSQIQKAEAQAACNSLGLTLVDGGITSATEVDSTLNGLVAQGIQGLFVPTDNMIAAAMASMKETLENHGLVTVCADSNVVANGGSLGLLC
jgi:putative ABC transport system substrate-binding protein